MPTFIERSGNKIRYKKVGEFSFDSVKYQEYTVSFNSPILYYGVLEVERCITRSGDIWFSGNRQIIREDEWKEDWNGEILHGNYVNNFDLDYVAPSYEGEAGNSVTQQVAQDVYFDLIWDWQTNREYTINKIKSIEWTPPDTLKLLNTNSVLLGIKENDKNSNI